MSHAANDIKGKAEADMARSGYKGHVITVVCPVCDGAGVVQDPLTTISNVIRCIECGGSGVVPGTAQQAASDAAEEPNLVQRVAILEGQVGTLKERLQSNNKDDKIAFEKIWAAIEALEGGRIAKD